MNNTPKRQQATAYTFLCENGTHYTLSLANNDVEIHMWHDGTSDENVSEMTVMDLKQFIEAATHLLTTTGKNSSPLLSYPIARDII